MNKLPDKIHYQKFDSLGKLVSVLQDSDANEATGGTAKDNEGEEVKGIDNIQTLQHSYGEKLEIKENKTGNGDEVSTVYNVLDVYGRVVASYRNNDYNDSTGETLKVMVDGKEVVLNGIDSFETYQYNANGQLTEILRNLDAKGNAEEKVYIERDVSGNELGRYIDLDNNANTGMGNAGQDKAITLADGRVLKGVDRFETYTNDEKGNQIEIRRNLDAKGAFEEVEYRDVDSASGQLMGIYYNRDNDMKDGVALKEKTGETIELENGRRFEGIDNFTTYERDTQNRVITERFNLDAKGADDRVYYYDLDANGNRIGEYQNLDNDTTLTAEGKAQITGTTHTLEDGRTVQGIERYYEQKFDGNNRVYERTSNLDGKDHAESVSYYVRDALGREVARYDNTNNDVLSNGNPNPTGHSHTIMLNGKEVTVNGIDRIVENTYNEYGNATQIRTNNTGEKGDDKFTNITDRVYNERRQLESDSSKVKLESGEFAPSAANKYTYDIYGRQATREFDTDFSEDGFEKIETYGYDQHGYHISTQTNELGDEIAVNQRREIERDIFGRAIVERMYQADGTLVSKEVSEFDHYDNKNQLSTYSTEDQVTAINTYTFDEYSRILTGVEDRNGNNIFDDKDRKFTLTYDTLGLVIGRLNSEIENGKEITKNYQYRYNERNLRHLEFIDNNNNGVADNDEIVTHISYVKDTPYIDKFEYSYGMDKANILSEWKFVFADAGEGGSEHIAGIRTEVEPAQSYIKYGVHSVMYSTKDNYTTGNWAKLLEAYKGKIHVAYLTNENANTEITIDKQVIANLAPGKEFTIFGDKTDTVNLKNGSDFVKKVGTVEIGGQTFDQYTTEVDGQSYTLRLDSDINVVLA